VGARLPRKRHLRNSGAVDYQSLDQFNVLGRIDTVMATGENGDRAGLQAGAVCCRIDAARETGDDGDSRSTEITRHSVGEFHASGRSVAGSDDRDLRPHEDVRISTDADQRRRVVDHLQAQRIARLAYRNVLDAPCTCGLQFRRGLFARENAWRGC
jgi:hypothetical protein